MRRWAFTLLEILIIIAVFAIGIMAVLRMSLQNMTTMQTVEQRTAATFLAQEWLELLYHMRDSNNLSHLPWNCILAQEGDDRQQGKCSSFLSSGSYWTIGMDSVWYTHISLVDSHASFAEQIKLTLLSGSTYSGVWYTYDTHWTPTVFSRYLLITGVQTEEWVLPLSSLIKVESHVQYTQGTRTGEVVLQSFIWNY